jgi:hypothetical protein
MEVANISMDDSDTDTIGAMRHERTKKCGKKQM